MIDDEIIGKLIPLFPKFTLFKLIIRFHFINRFITITIYI